MKLISAFGAVLVLALFAAACGGSDGGNSAADQALIDAIAAELDSDPPPGEFEYDTNCMAKGVVDELGGAETIKNDYGITAADISGGRDIADLNLSESAALSVTNKIWGCADFGELMMTGLAGEGITGDDASCLLDAIGEDPVKKLIAVGFMSEEAGAALGDSASEELFTVGLDAVVECGVTAP